MKPNHLSQTTEASTIANLALDAAEGKQIFIGGSQLLLTPDGIKATDLTKHLPRPPRKKGFILLHTLADLIAYSNTHVNVPIPGPPAQDTDISVTAQTATAPITVGIGNVPTLDFPVLFANRNDFTFTLIADFHTREEAGWAGHRAAYKLEHSPEFLTWRGNQNKWLSQADFAELLDTNLTDITSPPQTEIITLVQNFEHFTSTTVRSGAKIQTGEFQLTYNSENDANKTTKVPPSFELSVPIWKTEQNVFLTAKLYFRVREGRVEFRYQLEKLERILEKLWSEQVDLLRMSDHSARVYQGAPPNQTEYRAD